MVGSKLDSMDPARDEQVKISKLQIPQQEQTVMIAHHHAADNSLQEKTT